MEKEVGELKEGMYVRTSNGISQILSTYKPEGFDSLSLIDSGSIIRGFFIKKASFNIIDLIEVGDYVNGFLVSDFDNLGGCKFIITRQITLGGMEAYIPNEHIKAVLTHEQYKRNIYEVE